MKSRAKSTYSLCPADLKALKSKLRTPLTKIFNHILQNGHFPINWLETKMFFIHKKGDLKDPNNYRSISIQNPLMKLFCHILAQRLTSFSEKENLIPDFQFAYRKRRSPISAASLLHNIIDSRLNRKNKKGSTNICCIYRL